MRGAVSAGGLLELGNLGFRQVRNQRVFCSVIVQQMSWTTTLFSTVSATQAQIWPTITFS